MAVLPIERNRVEGSMQTPERASRMLKLLSGTDALKQLVAENNHLHLCCHLANIDDVKASTRNIEQARLTLAKVD